MKMYNYMIPKVLSALKFWNYLGLLHMGTIGVHLRNQSNFKVSLRKMIMVDENADKNYLFL